MIDEAELKTIICVQLALVSHFTVYAQLRFVHGLSVPTWEK